MSLIQKTEQMLNIIDTGGFTRSNGEWIDIKEFINYSVSHSITYTPEMCAELPINKQDSAHTVRIEVTDESTQVAVKRLVDDGCDDVLALNFASAINPGGSFMQDTVAQEEDLARCSALYPCLQSQTQYYENNRNHGSVLYTDHIIYSPNIPWFRVHSLDEPDAVYMASVITAPAPNAAKAPTDVTPKAIKLAMHQRCGYVLRVAKENGHRNLVLGAWGCGVFGNDPRMVASVFADWLKDTEFTGVFDKIVFAIMHNETTRCNYEVFRAIFSEKS